MKKTSRSVGKKTGIKSKDGQRHLWDERHWSTTLSILILIIILIPLIGVFANKAFHIDDPLFLWVAKHIQSSPTDPYRFNVTWYFDEMEMWQVTKNPPFTSYFIAFVAYFVGWSEKALHLAFLIPVIMVVLGTYFLARKMCVRPVLASMVGLITPVFFVSSTTIMCDTMMLAFWVWAILLWIRGTERNEYLAFALSALLVAVCALTKYYGMSLIILLPIYTVVKNRKIGLWLLYLLIPILILILYQWKTHALYGRGLLLDAAAYASEFRGNFNYGLAMRGLIGLGFAGGCLVSLLFYTPFLWSRNVLLIQLAGSMITLLTLPFVEMIGIFPLHNDYGVKWSQVIQLTIMMIIGMNLLALTLLDLWNHKGDALSLLLFCWIMGTFTFASFINWTLNGRSILPMAPAVGILLVRRIEQQALSFKRPPAIFLPLVPALFVALLVAWADYELANSARFAVEKIYTTYNNEQKALWFQGHWGFQYYMELRGARVAQMRQFRFDPGDILIIPENNSNIFPIPPDRLVILRETIELSSPCRWLTTMNRFGGAGFYNDICGPLPFVIGSILPERYHILEIEPARQINNSLSVIDKNKEEYDKAISYYTQALIIDPFYAKIYNDRGNIYFLKGEYDKAISDYTQALRIDSKDVETYQKRGTIYFRKREYDKAIFDFDQMLRINPNDPRAYHNRGVAYFQKGEYDKAWEDVKKAQTLGVDINPAFLEQLRKFSGRQ